MMSSLTNMVPSTEQSVKSTISRTPKHRFCFPGRQPDTDDQSLSGAAIGSTVGTPALRTTDAVAQVQSVFFIKPKGSEQNVKPRRSGFCQELKISAEWRVVDGISADSQVFCG
jgi:hypothetical protein